MILRQLLAGAADPEHAVAAALAVWRGDRETCPNRAILRVDTAAGRGPGPLPIVEDARAD
ncbi:hypothetical protein [Nocardia camponoti]|uniref:Uncharacterized protein n=1 Tax=Nocardia camponoti TaxID=1616106 RepID=A0A917VEI9_9NOCA|nr:hypothetical protein [Nocardia camponoti]GGK69296.1 hypothetical protein GCM10011591_46760 [Nocardia camponoti]